MKTDKKLKLVVNNEKEVSKLRQSNVSKSMTNPIYGKYLVFTGKKSKRKISIREFLDELF